MHFESPERKRAASRHQSARRQLWEVSVVCLPIAFIPDVLSLAVSRGVLAIVGCNIGIS